MATAVATGPRDLREQRRLVELEGVIQGGLQTFVEVGEALLEIRGSRLYRFTHGTFEEYAKKRWGLSQSRSYQLMDAAAVAGAIGSTTVEVANEAQARELAPVLREHGPEAVREAWTATVEQTNGHPTAQAIRRVVAEVTDTAPEEPSIDDRHWRSLASVLDAIEALAVVDAPDIAATIPHRRRAATARRIRKLGTFLGGIAWTIEGEESADGSQRNGTPEGEEVQRP